MSSEKQFPQTEDACLMSQRVSAYNSLDCILQNIQYLAQFPDSKHFFANNSG